MKETIKKNDPDAYDVKANIKLMLEDCWKQANASQTDPIVHKPAQAVKWSEKARAKKAARGRFCFWY